jgi:hypothetical protein
MLNRAIVAAFIATTAAAFGLQRSKSGDLASAASAENRTGSVGGSLQMTSNLAGGDTNRTKAHGTVA